MTILGSAGLEGSLSKSFKMSRNVSAGIVLKCSRELLDYLCTESCLQISKRSLCEGLLLFTNQSTTEHFVHFKEKNERTTLSSFNGTEVLSFCVFSFSKY